MSHLQIRNESSQSIIGHQNQTGNLCAPTQPLTSLQCRTASFQTGSCSFLQVPDDSFHLALSRRRQLGEVNVQLPRLPRPISEFKAVEGLYRDETEDLRVGAVQPSCTRCALKAGSHFTVSDEAGS